MLNNFKHTDYTFWDFQGTFELSLIDTIKEAYQRGSVDYYYRRKCKPNYRYQDSRCNHLYVKVDETDMTEAEIQSYKKGYEEETEKKDWG